MCMKERRKGRGEGSEGGGRDKTGSKGEGRELNKGGEGLGEGTRDGGWKGNYQYMK